MTTLPGLHLDTMVRVHRRFHRSSHLIRDMKQATALDHGYLETPTTQQFAERILHGATTPGGTRCWSLTGPFGSGKSSFLLAFTRKLTQEVEPRPWLAVTVVGQRGPLRPALLEALAQALQSSANVPAQVSRARALAEQSAESGFPDERIAEAFEDACFAAQGAGFVGLCLMIDELGKFLEFSAFHPDQEDVFVLQTLAELAARSPFPFLVVTALHVGFADYLPATDPVRQAEWAKVQGRYEDIAFRLPAVELLELMAGSLVQEFDSDSMASYHRELAPLLEEPALASVVRSYRLERLAPRCVPLHPITALLLVQVFRGELAQNERSLFSFLGSDEPYGFQHFLKHPPSKGTPWYLPEQLYNYLQESMGGALLRGLRARAWSELEQALGRLGDADGEGVQVLKTIGLLHLCGRNLGLVPSTEVLHLCLPSVAVDACLERLRQRKLVLYRGPSEGWGVYEGSDFDLGTAYARAEADLGSASLAEMLEEALQPEPILAKRHYHETGYLRGFAVRFKDMDDPLLGAFLRKPPEEGCQIVFVIGDEHRLKGLLSGPIRHANIQNLVAVPAPHTGIRAAVIRVRAWALVAALPELAGDRVARAEVAAQHAHALAVLDGLTGALFGQRGMCFQPELCRWYAEGTLLPITHSASFHKELSALMDRIYRLAPAFKNELFNRDVLSTAASKARNLLMRRMLDAGEQRHFGIVGHPPEKSLVMGMLVRGGFHVKHPNGYAFGVPEGPWRFVWDEVLSFLETNHGQRIPLVELYRRLQAPPYGLRSGVLPVLMACILLVHREEVGLSWKEGGFVAELRAEHLELMARRPEQFCLRRFVIGEDQRSILNQVAEALAKLDLLGQGAEPHLLGVVKPLVVFASKLSDYTKHTWRLPEEARALRDLLLKANDPSHLLFQEVLAVLGLDAARANELAARLGEQLRALDGAFGSLLDEVGNQVRLAFGLPEGDEAWPTLRDRAELVGPYAHTPDMQYFLRELAPNRHEDIRVALALGVSGGKPPHSWRDADVTKFQAALAKIQADFIRLEHLVRGRTDGDGQARTIVRVELLGGDTARWDHTYHVPPELEGPTRSLCEQLESVLGGNQDQAVVLAALTELLGRRLNGGQS